MADLGTTVRGMTVYHREDSEREPFDTRKLLAKAAQQAKERNYDDFLIVDTDVHHYETESWSKIVTYIENPIIRRLAETGTRRKDGRSGLLVGQIGDQDVSGRISRYQLRSTEQLEDDKPRDVAQLLRAMEQIGTDYAFLFPTPMLNLGLHPQAEIETAVAKAYAAWMTDIILPADHRIRAMLFLPFNDPEACLAMIEKYADFPGVEGFMITSVRRRPVHHKDNMKIFSALNERRKPLAFHAGYYWMERSFEQLNRFISVHALGFPFYNMIHLTNWVINGMPERFPDLKVIWIEAGLAWIPFLMQRLDNEYMMRTSEAPLLQKKPSEYMREFYYTTQPMEQIDNLEAMELTFKMINAETQLLYASDYPHWDFDLPSTIYDLPFLSEEAKRRILGGNARELFGLEDTKATRRSNG